MMSSFPTKAGLCLVFAVVCLRVKVSDGVKSGSIVNCSRSDPKLNECLIKASTLFFASFTELQPRFPAARLRDPQKVGTILSKTGDSSIGLIFKLNDNLLYGQSKDVVKDLSIDLKRRELKVTLFCPRFQLLSKYEMSGKVLILPITGKGNGNITSVNTYLDMNIKWDTVKRDGVKYLKPRTYTYKIRPERTYLNFENLFNGDKYLGSQMNQFMNDNYKELNAAFMPVFEKVLAEEDKAELEAILSTIPYDDIFLD
uniref:Protein takeout n=1 Tax=Cacopsylla melanoneura TaxID=428564 RepID=A0A8D8YE63_9HEMI